MTYELSESIVIDASPEAVYDLVSDITRTGEWSEQTFSCSWDSHARGVGATFTGHNRHGTREWTTTSTVLVAQPNAEFSWEVAGSGTRWGYRLAPENGGTRLTEYTAFTAAGEAFFLEKYGDGAIEQIQLREHAALHGIPATLARCKALAES